MIAWSQSLPGAAGRVRLALTDRDGGVSVGPWGAPTGGGLNLATHVDDDPAHVATNRQRVCAELSVPPEALVVADQVHGREVVQVSGPCSEPPVADALVTDRPGLALMVLVADCVPVLLADAERGVVGVAHAGRPGMAAGVVGAAVAAMRDLGARDLVARLGPSVCPRCYEVPLAMREDVAACRPETRSVTWEGRPSIDVAAGVLAQLTELDVPARPAAGLHGGVRAAVLLPSGRSHRAVRRAGLAGGRGVRSDARTAELEQALAAVRERIARACAEAGRDPGDVTLVVVTKTFPADDVVRLLGLGVRDVGENRDQDARAKVQAVLDSGVPDAESLRWHFVGQLQRNKAGSVARYADVVQSVDRAALVTALSRGAVAADRELTVLLQLDLDPPGAATGRGGAAPSEVLALAEQVQEADGLTLRGVMGVAPLAGPTREAFTRLADAAALLRERVPDATWMSAGMSSTSRTPWPAARHTCVSVARSSDHVRHSGNVRRRHTDAWGVH